MNKSTALYLLGVLVAVLHIATDDPHLATMAYSTFLASMILKAIEDKT